LLAFSDSTVVVWQLPEYLLHITKNTTSPHNDVHWLIKLKSTVLQPPSAAVLLKALSGGVRCYLFVACADAGTDCALGEIFSLDVPPGVDSVDIEVISKHNLTGRPCFQTCHLPTVGLPWTAVKVTQYVNSSTTCIVTQWWRAAGIQLTASTWSATSTGDEPIGTATLSLEQIKESNGDVIRVPVMSKKGMAGELEVTASVADAVVASAPPAAAAAKVGSLVRHRGLHHMTMLIVSTQNVGPECL
jgi:hypothetical protein